MADPTILCACTRTTRCRPCRLRARDAALTEKLTTDGPRWRKLRARLAAGAEGAPLPVDTPPKGVRAVQPGEGA